jgi:GntR family transcriptional repressor for pyruvate dehydrogenase complex
VSVGVLGCQYADAVALTDVAIKKIRELIRSGELAPGARLPPENVLAGQLGLSRSTMREAIKALELARVVDVRRGDGTFVTSLAPALLLGGMASAVDLLRDETLLEVMEVRRMLEPVATQAAVAHRTPELIAALEEIVDGMREAANDADRLLRYDIEFHRMVVSAVGNETLTAVLDGLSGQTVRARLWRGLIEARAGEQTLAEHIAILDAIRAGDAALAHAAALVHVNTSERWMRANVSSGAVPDDDVRDQLSVSRT